MRRYRKRRRNSKKKLIILSLICFLFIMVGGYAAFSTNINIIAKGNILEKSRVIRSWPKNSNEDFHTDYYRENIVSATFVNNNNVPDNATESWNVSEDKNKGGVMAWVIPNNEDSTKYDLYIGANNGVVANENSSNLFYNFQKVESINFNNNFNTSNVTNMSSMFQYCTSISVIDVSSFNTSNVTNMVNMFSMFNNNTSSVMDNKLTEIILGDNFSIKSVISIAQIFAGCNKIEALDVSNWDTSNIHDMSSAFAYCQNLKELDLSKWDTSNATNMAWMFMRCDNLQDLNISNFNTSKVTTMRNMFTGDRSLKILNLCSFNTSNVTSMYYMFNSTVNLQQIKVGSGWTTNNVSNTTEMFTNSGVSSVTTGEC